MKSLIHLLVPDLSIDLTLLSMVLNVLVALLIRMLVDLITLFILRFVDVDRVRLNLRGTIPSFAILGRKFVKKNVVLYSTLGAV